MRFIFVTDELPRPDRAGHLAMNHAILAWLRDLGHHVTILLVGGRLGGFAERYGVAPVAGPGVISFGGNVVTMSPRAGARALLRRLPPALAETLRRRHAARRFAAAQAILGSFITPEEVAWCARAIAKARPDAVLADTIFRSPVLPAIARQGPRRIIIAHDVFHRRHQALTAAGYSVYPSELSAATEAALLATAGAVVAIQPEEAAMIREMCPGQEVFAAPMPALPKPRPAEIERSANRLVFVGSGSLPNLDGLRWFLESVWPQLRRWRGDLRLDIVGTCGAALLRLPNGVERLGRVETLAPILHHAALAIAPLRVGSGLKIKLLDYARHGLMTVATPASLAGFAPDLQAPFIAAASEIAFAAAVIRQLADPAEDARALRYVERHYGTAASFAGLATALGLDAVQVVGA